MEKNAYIQNGNEIKNGMKEIHLTSLVQGLYNWIHIIFLKYIKEDEQIKQFFIAMDEKT